MTSRAEGSRRQTIGTKNEEEKAEDQPTAHADAPVFPALAVLPLAVFRFPSSLGLLVFP